MNKNPYQPWETGYWEYRAKNPPKGRTKALTPTELWKFACEYFERTAAKENAFKKQDFIKGGDAAGTIIELDQMRPFTWAGLEVYLGEKNIIDDLELYRANRNNAYSDFKGVIRNIDKIMYAQKFEGAASGVFNANIIARDLGLAEKSNVTVREEQPLFGDNDESNNDK